MLKTSAYRRAYGQYFTPEPIVACCYMLLAGRLPPNPRIADPACGDGAFLRYAAAHSLAAPQDLYGCDVDAALAGALAAEGLPNVCYADGLDRVSLPEAAFDLVVGNPPFGVATASGGVQPLASEVRFLLRAIDLARLGGYIALVLPSGVLANERLRAVRAALLGRCTLLAAIALPRDAFRRAGTTAACSILLLERTPATPGHHAFFALAQDLADLPAIVDDYHDRRWTMDDGRWTTHNGRRTTDDGRTREQPAQYGGPSVAASVAADKDEGPRTTDHGPPTTYWLPQTTALAQRMDPHFWRPDFRLLLEHMAARHTLHPLGELLGRGGLIAGDHVRPSRGEARGPGLPYEYYQTREFMPAGYNYAAIERCDERAYRRLGRTTVRQRDILVSCAGVGGAGQGRVCLVTHRPGPSCTGDVFILRAARPDPAFLFLFLRSRCGRAQLLRLQNGVGTANLSADELLQVQVPLVPPAIEQVYSARYLPIAGAHDAAMAALARGDGASFARQRTQSAALLAELRRDLEEMMLGG
ncbi:MAG: N-6 DNA methylase [Roseiflexaceae bacterium]